MNFLGIDPGTQRIGYGVVKTEGSSICLVDAGILPIRNKREGAALLEAKRGVDALLKKYKPQSVGVETLFFSKNQKTAIAVAQARGVILLSAEERGVPVREYGPNQVKLGIAGYGSADKKAVLKMVRLILHENDLEVIDDASDALALAIIASGDRTSIMLD